MPKPKKANRAGKPIQVYVGDDTREAIDQFIAAQRFDTTITDVAETAILEFLRKEGYYPPKKKNGKKHEGE